MDAAAVHVPIPVQPAELPQQPAAADAAPDSADAVPAFAETLEQQLAQSAVPQPPAQLLLTPTDPRTQRDASPDTTQPASPDALLALMAGAAPQPVAGHAESTDAPAAGGVRGPAVAAHASRPGTAAAPARAALDPARDTPPMEPRAGPDLPPSNRFAMRDAAAALPMPDFAQRADVAGAPALPLQAMGTVPGAPAAARQEPHIAARVGSDAWGTGLAQQVTLIVKEGEHTAQLRLDPPELGPLEVKLTFAREDDGVAHAQFVSPHPAVREAVEAALPQLRASLADSGITLGQASVGEGYVRDDGREAQRFASADTRRGPEAAGASAGPARPVVRHGLVDTFA